MIIIQCKTYMRKEELQAYRAQFMQQAREGGVVYLPPNFEVVYNGNKQPIVVQDRKGQLCTD